MDEQMRVRWACTILEYVRREGRWGMKDVDILRNVLSRTAVDAAWWTDNEPTLRRWYGEPLLLPDGVVS